MPETDYRNLDLLKIRKRQFRRPDKSPLKPISSFDTETYKGNLFLVCDSDRKFLDDITPDKTLAFFFNYRNENRWNFFFNLAYDAEVILKTIFGDSLYLYNYTRKLGFEYKDYNLKYFPKKCLSIRKGHHAVNFYDIAQFFMPNNLVTAYEKNIQKVSQEYLDFKNKRKEFSPKFYRRNTTAVRNYCIADCIMTKELSEHWIKLFYEIFNFYPERWLSSGYIAEKVLINAGLAFPLVTDIDKEIQTLAYACYFHARVELLKREFIGTAYLYDINSAYPYAITKIPDFTDGEWINDASIHPKAALGFFKIECDIPEGKRVAPFIFRKDTEKNTQGKIIKSPKNFFPSGNFITYATLAELLACENSKFYTILEGWQFILNSNYKPWKDFIENLYNERLELKNADNPAQQPIKIILNALYGKTGQTKHGIGNLFNPVIFSFITGFTRAELYKFVIDYQLEKDVICFATDSICTTKNLHLDTSELGRFKLDKYADDVKYAKNGFYHYNGRWSERGFGKLGNKYINALQAYIDKNGQLAYKYEELTNTTLKQGIIRHKIPEIGHLTLKTKNVHLNNDRKRRWFGSLHNLNSKESNDSHSLILNADSPYGLTKADL